MVRPTFSSSAPSSQVLENNKNSDSIAKERDIFSFFYSLRRKHIKNLFLGHLNVNSLRNKFESVELLTSKKFDIFLNSECKLNSTFPDAPFFIPEYKLFRKDRDKNG